MKSLFRGEVCSHAPHSPLKNLALQQKKIAFAKNIRHHIRGLGDALHIMADIDEKNEKNVPGKFYVDSNCIDCDLCRESAPDFFARDDDEGVSYVKKQPVTDEELASCTEAMEGCPVQAIGDDGE